MLGAKRVALAPYGGGLLPPQFNDYANKTDGLKPIRTVRVLMLGAKRAVLATTMLIQGRIVLPTPRILAEFNLALITVNPDP